MIPPGSLASDWWTREGVSRGWNVRLLLLLVVVGVESGEGGEVGGLPSVRQAAVRRVKSAEQQRGSSSSCPSALRPSPPGLMIPPRPDSALGSAP